MKVKLNAQEIAALDRQDPNTLANGGFQRFLVNQQRKLNRETGEIDLDDSDLDKIRRYAFKYGNGGWERRLIAIYGRSLGPDLSPTEATGDAA
jgi:hypothetical protein